MRLINYKNIRILCLIASIIVLCSVLASCGEDPVVTEEVPSIATEEAATTEEITTAADVETIVPEDEILEEVETREENEEYKLTLADLEIGDTSWAYFIVNRTNYIPAGYEQNLNLEGVWSNGRYYYFDSRIADYALCMINDAARDGVTLLVCSAYRSHSSQTANFENQVKAYASAKYSFADAYTYTSRYIAIPGTSEHQTGLAVDFITPGYMYLDDGFENTAAYKWLSENSYKYGFILRYPSSKSAETGINYEPWHFRFIGFEYAEDIYNSGLCLEEYMESMGDVEFNPMAPLVIPAEPAWYQSYINPPEPETEETDSAEETDSELSDETSSDESETDTSEGEETDTNESDSDEEIPDWLRTEAESTEEDNLESDEAYSSDEEADETESDEETDESESEEETPESDTEAVDSEEYDTDVTDTEVSDTEAVDTEFEETEITEEATETEAPTTEEETETATSEEDFSDEIESEYEEVSSVEETSEEE